jgi:hypothetical protein
VSAWRPTTASVVAVAAGSVTAALAVASSQGWLSGAAVELLLAIGVVVVAICVGWLVLQAVIVVLLRAATSVVAPARPFALERILRLMELQALEREAAAGAERERRPRV